MGKQKEKLKPEDEALELAFAHGRAKLLPFCQLTYEGETPFLVNWHHRVLAEAVEKFIARAEGFENLMVFMPPGAGKSQIISRHAPAFILGRRPRARIIATSYSSELAEGMNRDVQNIIDSESYRFLFPGTTLSGENVAAASPGKFLRNSTTFETVPSRGSYRCAGVKGAILGTRADYIFIDDPFKHRSEAESPVVREEVFEWYRSTLYSRRAKGAGICLVMQRWHDDDLAGRIIKLAKEDPNYPQFKIIKFPMISTDEQLWKDPRKTPGQLLWPEMFGERDVLGIKAVQGSRNFQAMYQQNPNEEKGNEVKEGWLKHWHRLPEYPDRVVISVDASFKGAKAGVAEKNQTTSYVAIQVWMQKGTDFYLVDQDRRRMGFLETIAAIKAMRAKWPSVLGLLIEDKANGPAIIETLEAEREIPGILPVMPYGSKLARLRAVTPIMEAGNVFIPSPETHDWVPAYEKELKTYAPGAEADQVDTTSQALKYLSGEGLDFLAALTT